ncbi:MAG: hypothetical protein V7K88_14790 [Nostoc sp.]|uniref:hypothetical protein n=1 Tax=Nostoc sp. TaxID=1180 RepID=UPI002FFC3894
MHHQESLYTVSLGVEGNGPNFPVHIGAYIALLENNLIPTVVIGGSSASVTGSLLMGLLENPSLINKSLKSEYCHLTKAQKGALILAILCVYLTALCFFLNLQISTKLYSIGSKTCCLIITEIA